MKVPSKKRKPKFKETRRHSAPKKPKTVEYLLEQTSPAAIVEAKKTMEARIKYHWDYYSELAFQRNQIADDLKKALLSSTRPYSFKKWQRAVKWRYGLHPLCTLGSINFIGNRFNMGQDLNPSVTPFQALYIASDKSTAIQEALGQVEGEDSRGLSALELALANPQSETIVSISGSLESVIDLTAPQGLDSFVDLIKDFTISEGLVRRAKELNLTPPIVLKKSSQLLELLLNPDWKSLPTMEDDPAGPQIFGELVYKAGIEGILYPSRLTQRECLAIFPKNFVNTSSYIELDDTPPLSGVPKRIDENNWKLCEISQEKLPI